MMAYIEFHLTTADESTAEILVALLSEMGFDTFEQDENNVFAYIHENEFNETIEPQIIELQSQFVFTYASKHIAQKNWNEEWENNFQPVEVEGRCLIRATFHAPGKNFEEEIVIEPRMAFGTGHHESTYLMVQQMLDMQFDEKFVCDAGCGTGILAILAAKRNAKKVIAIDNNEWAYNNALDNLAINNVTEKVQLELGEPEMLQNRKFDIILANINKSVILENLHLFAKILQPKGQLLVSGILIPDLQDITMEAEKYKLQLWSSHTRNDWVCALYTAN
ncbi:MAG: 50S ribosomal protein L11 methyltransferase [Chitinophagales bacterium]